MSSAPLEARATLTVFVSFAIGTLAVERTMNLLGRFDATTETRSLLPVMRKTDTHVFAHSLPQARYLALILGSLIHACFFVIMGSDSGFSSILVAYAVAAFARSFLTGKHPLKGLVN